jgi:hypothetical protein
MSKLRWGVLCISLALLAGCSVGSPVASCTDESVAVDLTGTLDGVVVTGSGSVSDGNVGSAAFADLRRYFIEGAPLAGREVVFTVERIGPGTLAVFFPGVVTGSLSVTVDRTITRGGGWGTAASIASGAGVSWYAGSVDGVAITGIFTVLASAPLRLGFDLTIRDTAGATRRLAGTMAFSSRSVSVGC